MKHRPGKNSPSNSLKASGDVSVARFRSRIDGPGEKSIRTSITTWPPDFRIGSASVRGRCCWGDARLSVPGGGLSL
jgi:hypothetical protein